MLAMLPSLSPPSSLRPLLRTARCVGVLSALVAVGTPAPAGAAPSEAPIEVAVNPARPDSWAVRYEGIGGGLLLSDDAGASWTFMCNDAIATALTRGGTSMTLASSGDVISGSLDGAWRVSQGGCESAAEPVFGELWVSDLAIDPSNPERLYAVTSSSNADNGLLRYDTGTDAWEFLGAREPLPFGSITAVTLEDGVRLYESVLTSETTADDAGTEQFKRFALLRHSDDEGQSWTSFRAFDGTSAREVTVEAVDPTDPNRILVVESHGRDNAMRDRLWLNGAAGDPEASELLAEVEWFGGAVFGPSGELWFADGEGSLFSLPQGETTPVELVRNAKVRCLTHSPTHGGLLACQPFGVALVEADGNSRMVLDFRTVSSWVSCDNGLDVAAQCEARLGMQDGWCSATHYPFSGICGTYCYPGVQPRSAAPSELLADHCPGAEAPDAGAPSPVDAGSDDAAAPAIDDASVDDAKTAPTDAGDAEVPAAKPSSGGCHAYSPDPTGSSQVPLWLLALGLGLGLWRYAAWLSARIRRERPQPSWCSSRSTCTARCFNAPAFR